MGKKGDATRILTSMTDGDAGAVEQLLPVVYKELRALAAVQMARERPSHTLQATALVHEAYLRLVGQDRSNWKNRAQFMAVASEMIRRILVDHARKRHAKKRGGDQGIRVAFTPEIAAATEDGGEDVDVLALDAALQELGEVNDRHRRVVELRYFGGLSVKEAALVLGVSEETVKLDWRTARAWLRMRLKLA